MNNYVTGSTIKKLREDKGMTQAQLAQIIGVGSKAVSKWETAKGLPDITLIEPLAKALGVTVTELFSGEKIVNRNMSCNILRSKIYVCPVCGNVIIAGGDAVICCCGIALPPLEAEECDGEHTVKTEKVEDEYFISIDHEMTKEHYISFAAYVTSDRFQMVKFYPEGNAQTRFKLVGRGVMYIYCNKHGLYKMDVKRR